MKTVGIILTALLVVVLSPLIAVALVVLVIVLLVRAVIETRAGKIAGRKREVKLVA